MSFVPLPAPIACTLPPPHAVEPLLPVPSAAEREALLAEAQERRRALAEAGQVLNRVVYDSMVFVPAAADKVPGGALLFESRFESGNLFCAARIGLRTYHLRLCTDYNTDGHTQWFYFQVHRPAGSRGDGGTPEGGGATEVAGAAADAAQASGSGGCEPADEKGREGDRGREVGGDDLDEDDFSFNIVNMYKPDSLYNYGLLPLVYSVQEGGGWLRKGTNVSYAKTEKQESEAAAEAMGGGAQGRRARGKPSYTLSFQLRIARGDTIYVAHCYPYTYSNLQEDLDEMETDRLRAKHVRRNRAFCHTRAGNPMDMLTVTDFGTPAASGQRPVVVISARVHPGETNASWMMRGIIAFLTGSSDEAKALRQSFEFRIFPMLNPDGVINGNYRCNLAVSCISRV